MTIQEIKTYLNRHYFLVFKYQSQYYSLMKIQKLFYKQYALIATDTLYPPQKSFDKLCEEAFICNNTLLADAVKNIEIPDFDDPSWGTYEAVRHNAIVHNAEIHFLYNKRYYWISHASHGTYYLTDDLGNHQTFVSCRELFETARINGNSLKDIWSEVVVDAC